MNVRKIAVGIATMLGLLIAPIVLAAGATTPTGDSATADGYINLSESTAGFVLSVDYTTYGAVEGDVLSLVLADGTQIGATHPIPGGAGDTSSTTQFTILGTDLGVNGAKEISSKISGTVNATSTTFLALTLDTVAPTLPTVTIASDNASTTLATGGDDVAVTFTISENLQLPTVTIAGRGAVISGNPTTGIGTITVIPPDTNGPVVFSINYMDLAGNSGTAVTATTDGTMVRIDTLSPTVSISYEPNHAIKSGSTVVASVTLTEAIVGSLEYHVSGFTSATSSMTMDDATHYHATITAGAGDGTASITFDTATDAAGNLITATPTSGPSFEVDNMAPLAPVITSVAGDNKVNASEALAIIVVGTAEANSTTTVSITDGTNTVTKDGLTDGSGNYSVTLNGTLAIPAALADGALVVTTFATDPAGNAGPTTTYGTPVTQNTAVPLPPTPTLTNPINNTGSTTVSFTGTAQGNTTLNYLISDGTRYLSGSTAVGAGGTFSVLNLDLHLFAEGSITGAATTTDSVGNTSNIGSATPSTKDTIGPVFSSITPADNAYIKNVTGSSQVIYSVNEAMSAGTVVFTSTGIVAGGTHTCTLKGIALASGAHTLDLSDTTNGCTIAQTLVSGAVYSVAFSGTDVALNAGATYISTGVTFDDTMPTLPMISVLSSNASTSLAKVGDVITITATSSEALSLVTGTIAGRAATVTATADPLVYKLSTTVLNGDTFSFSINFTDLAGNTNTASAINDGPAVVIDTTAPTASIGYSLARAVKAGTLLTITATLSEPIADATGLQFTLSGAYALGPALMDKVSATEYSTTTLIMAGDGTETVALSMGTDLAGNVITSAPTAGSTFVVDNTVPTPLSLTAPTSPTNDNTPTVTLSSGEDGTLTYSGCYSGTTSVTAPSGAITFAMLAEGAHTCEIGVTDAAGNIASTTSTSFTVDTIAPTILTSMIVSNNASTTLAKAGNTITSDITIDESVQSVTATIAGRAAVVTGSGTSYSAALSIISGDTQGTATVAWSFTDGANAVTPTYTAGTDGTRVSIDTIAPITPVFTSAAGDSNINASEVSRVTIIGTAEPFATVLLTLTDSVSLVKSTTTSANAAGNFSDYINGSGLRDGAITLNITATDQVGNVGSATTVALLLDSTPPTAPVISLGSYINRAASTTVPVSITGEGLTTANYILTDNALTMSSALASVITTGVAITPNGDASGLLDGTVTVSVALTDAVGNVSATTTATILKDTVLPVFSSVTPASSAFTNNVTTNSSISFTNSKILTSGTVVFTQTGGTADAGSPRTCILIGTALATGTHTLNLSDTVNSCAITVTLTDGSIYTIAFDGQDSVANPAGTTTKTSVTYDVTPPVITINIPTEGLTIATTTLLSGATNEFATCAYSLDSASSLGLTASGGNMTHSKTILGVTSGAHGVEFVCTDQASNTATSTSRGFTSLTTSGSSVVGGTGPVVFGGLAGQVNLPTSITSLDLNSNSPLFASTSLSTVSGVNLTLGGSALALNGGIVAGVNLETAQTVGDQTVIVGTGYRLVSGTSGEPIVFSNSSLSGTTLSIPDGTDVMGSATWDGKFLGPVSGSTAGSAPAGFTVGDAVTFGSDSSIILFSQPVTLIFTTTKPIVMKVAGSSTWVTPATCSGTFSAPTAPGEPAPFSECAISDSTQTKVVTYHLTTFGFITPIPPVVIKQVGNGPIVGSLNNNVGGGSTAGSNGPVVTQKQAPLSAPKISLIVPPATAQSRTAFRNAELAKIQLKIAELRREYTLALAREKGLTVPSSTLAKNPEKAPAVAQIKPKTAQPLANISALGTEMATTAKATTTKSRGVFESIRRFFGF